MDDPQVWTPWEEPWFAASLLPRARVHLGVAAGLPSHQHPESLPARQLCTLEACRVRDEVHRRNRRQAAPVIRGNGYGIQTCPPGQSHHARQVPGRAEQTHALPSFLLLHRPGKRRSPARYSWAQAPGAWRLSAHRAQPRCPRSPLLDRVVRPCREWSSRRPPISSQHPPETAWPPASPGLRHRRARARRAATAWFRRPARRPHPEWVPGQPETPEFGSPSPSTGCLEVCPRFPFAK